MQGLAVLQELVDIVPGAPLRRTDRGDFLRALEQADTSSSTSGARAPTFGGGDGGLKARLLRAIGEAAYDMPLPPRWNEQVDFRDYVYFSHALQAESRWDHPLLESFRETLAFARGVVDSQMSVAEAAVAIKEHLTKIQEEAAVTLRSWTGPHEVPGTSDEFFFNASTGESCWISPLDEKQYDLHARYWLLVQFLQRLHAEQPSEQPRSRAGSKSVNSLAVALTPRFAGSPCGARTAEETASTVDRTLSESGLSDAVRSHATEIAASLASSAPSFCPDAPLAVGSAAPAGPASSPPPRPPKPPRQLRHLAAPPRLSDMPTDSALRAPPPNFDTRPIGVGRGGAPPPPPSGPAPRSRLGLGQARVVTPPPPPSAGIPRFQHDIPPPSGGVRPLSGPSAALRGELGVPPAVACVAAKPESPKTPPETPPGSPRSTRSVEAKRSESPAPARRGEALDLDVPLPLMMSCDGWAGKAKPVKPLSKYDRLSSTVCVIA